MLSYKLNTKSKLVTLAFLLGLVLAVLDSPGSAAFAGEVVRSMMILPEDEEVVMLSVQRVHPFLREYDFSVSIERQDETKIEVALILLYDLTYRRD